MKPYRIDFENVTSPVPREVILEHVALNSTGATFLQPDSPHDIPLAIVGGGPSLRDHLDELRTWPGEIWAINSTCRWLSDHGVKSVMFSVDPGDPDTYPHFEYSLQGVERAYLSTGCHPRYFERLKGKVFAFHTHARDAGALCAATGSTSAVRAQLIALQRGFQRNTYFGCEGSWPFDASTHIHKDDTECYQARLIVRAGGVDYMTNIQMLLQSQELSEVIRTFPQFFQERSGGLLRAMIEHPDTWEIVALSEKLKNYLDPTATEPYRKAA